MYPESTPMVSTGKLLTAPFASADLIHSKEIMLGLTFAKPEIYEALEERGVKYAIRIPANENLERDIAELLKRPLGRGEERAQRGSVREMPWNGRSSCKSVRIRRTVLPGLRPKSICFTRKGLRCIREPSGRSKWESRVICVVIPL
jgi:hypothetical protein